MEVQQGRRVFGSPVVIPGGAEEGPRNVVSRANVRREAGVRHGACEHSGAGTTDSPPLTTKIMYATI